MQFVQHGQLVWLTFELQYYFQLLKVRLRNGRLKSQTFWLQSFTFSLNSICSVNMSQSFVVFVFVFFTLVAGTALTRQIKS